MIILIRSAPVPHTAPYGVKSGHMLLGPKMIADTSKMVPEDAHHQKQQVFRKKLFFQNFHKKNILHRVPPMDVFMDVFKRFIVGWTSKSGNNTFPDRHVIDPPARIK